MLGWRMDVICHSPGPIPAQPSIWGLSALGETWPPFLQFYPLMCLQAAAKVPLCSDFCWINSSYICSFSLLFFHCFIMSVKITHWTETECLLVYINSLCSPKSWNSFRYKKLGRPQPQSGRYVKKEMEDSGSKSTASKYFFGLILFILTEIG